MKKILFSTLLLSIAIFTSGCTSYFAAKYDDYNETFRGQAIYDPSYGRASIEAFSDKNGTICIGSTPFYQGIARYHFNLVCSDGRMITGNLLHGQNTGRAFTNRNETLTFKVEKKQKNLESIIQEYKNQVNTKPNLNNKKEPIDVIMQPNNF